MASSAKCARVRLVNTCIGVMFAVGHSEIRAPPSFGPSSFVIPGKSLGAMRIPERNRARDRSRNICGELAKRPAAVQAPLLVSLLAELRRVIPERLKAEVFS